MLNKELARRGVPMPPAATKEEWEAPLDEAAQSLKEKL